MAPLDGAFVAGVFRKAAEQVLDFATRTEKLLMKPADTPTAIHHYVSTACHHGQHYVCREVCKFCDAPCNCDCHGDGYA